ncbi:DUF2185 domain-containing protein [Rathayibacter iranicus]|uniref:DUF2185 domain-containing protein n=3 Tax=Rathayibacter iranicus TaxID=59737 RepID=A0AAD1EMD5_9MICO|nr:DUF2185 domain-containing protein [Rathayibacter iranicus]MWV32588.1 DUF2185 domain-containing protein [Rathayibacter iranicus NCPPB 2253 = VKM Ac-1602]PPI41060.1 DUF2185 domain-containing protein [Rathayibacter iranicus]PPI56971.1 DUF2185 domain-containing protein [Rathayibacter iranicus]PPI68105.1 DUF2185 domain-containing protein [Rathayibacter iranicus]
MEIIPRAGACLMTVNAWEGRAPVRWMLREPSNARVDNGWRIMSAADSSEYLADSDNWRITDFNDACEIEPALIGIYDLPVGSDLQIVIDEQGKRIVDTPTGQELTPDRMYVPPSQRR